MARPADPHAKEALVAAARVEFAKKGLRGARIEDVTAACGVSKGSFYLHFPSKEALFGELVSRFESAMGSCSSERLMKVRDFHANEGSVTSKDVAERTQRFLKMAELDLEADLKVLELMWEYRDVVNVLFTGTQGTEFEGVAWKMMDSEEDRIASDVKHYQSAGACRTDIPPEVFGSMIVGTYTRVALRMNRMTQKPDMREWAQSLQMLMREGWTDRGAAQGLQVPPDLHPLGRDKLPLPTGRTQKPRKKPVRATSGARRAAR
ncbi:MAG: helix-turn-helix transcriptional regulator [Deltaproteobacteria bacterium]|nr:helix-turn-helix transcriptional regulator [Deltaproteobacteria bacterium]